MRRRLLWMTGGFALVGGTVYRMLRRRRRPAQPDPAQELRLKLDESRAIVEEREQFESAETPVDRAEPGVEERRREVHDRAKTAIDEMRSDPEE